MEQWFDKLKSDIVMFNAVGKPVKIGITGTHGTGKTALAFKLAWMLKNEFMNKRIAIVSETARKCPMPVNKETSREAQLWIFGRQLQKEIEACQSNSVVICDRTLMDGLAYSHRAEFRDIVLSYLDATVEYMASYNTIFWMRPGQHQIGIDGFRDSDPEFQKEIDCILKGWIQRFKMNVIEYTGETI